MGPIFEAYFSLGRLPPRGDLYGNFHMNRSSGPGFKVKLGSQIGGSFWDPLERTGGSPRGEHFGGLFCNTPIVTPSKLVILLGFRDDSGAKG